MVESNQESTSLDSAALAGSRGPKTAPKGSVLLVGNFLSASEGIRAPIEDLAAWLERSGWKISVTSTKRSRPLRLLDMATTAWKRREDYAVAQVDVFSGPAFFWAEVVCWTLRRAGKPYVLTLHGGNLPNFAWRWPGRVRRLLRSAAVVTAPSPYLLSHMETLDTNVQIVPNALDLAKYRYRERNWPSPRLIWLRAFHRLYNPSLAPKVLALLAGEHTDITLTMIGPDKGDGSLGETRRVAAELKVADRVHILGPVPKSEVPYHLNTGDLFLNTANIDNTPVTVIEAMACGLPVVSTNVGGIPYFLEDREDSLLVAPNNAEEMANAVHEILTADGLASRLSANAREKVREFDWPDVSARWDRLLSLVCRSV